MNLNSLPGRTLPAILVILVIGFLAYSNSFQTPFVFDDKHAISENTIIRNLENYYTTAVGYEANPNRVIAYLTFAVNYHFGKLEVAGYHAVNLTIHLVTALLVFVLLRLTFRTPYFSAGGQGPRAKDSGSSPNSSFITPYSFIPLFAALLFVAHPVQTQAVTYIVQRMTSLATLFYLLSLVLYVMGRLILEERGTWSRGELGEKVNTKLSYFKAIFLIAGSVIAAILAMKTKEITFTLPVAVLLFEISFFSGKWKRRLLCLLPIIATLPIVPITVLSAGDSTGNLLSDISEQSRVQTTLSRMDYLFTQFRVIVTYLRLLILPINQNLDYDYQVYTNFFTFTIFLSFILLIFLFGLGIHLWFSSRTSLRISRLLSFGILWFFLTISVESSIIPIVDVIFEHRLYLPSIGAAAAFSTAYFLMYEYLIRWAGVIKIPAMVAVSLILCLSLTTWQRNKVWRDEISLWTDVVSKSPHKGRPINNLGVALESAGRTQKAMNVLTNAINSDPMYVKSYYNLADLYLVNGYPEAALPLLRAAITIKPDFDEAYVKMGAALIRNRNFSEATLFLEQNISRVSGNAEARFYLGAAYFFLGDREAARRELAVVSNLDPRLASDLEGLMAMGMPGLKNQ